MYAICLRLVADRHRAEELTQDAFVRAWQRLGSFEGRSAFSSWLYRLAVNVVIDSRRAQRRELAFLSGDELPDTPGPQAAPEIGLDLERAIAELPSGARLVYVLHEIEGYRHDEIADMTGIASGTSKAQLHRARRHLRKALSR